MTHLAHQDICRRADGSIDIGFYARQAGAMRQAAIADHGQWLWRAVRAFARTGFRAPVALLRAPVPTVPPARGPSRPQAGIRRLAQQL